MSKKKKKKRFEKDRLRKGIFILPNLFTTLNILFGFYSMVQVYKGNFATAALFIVFSGVFDILDGKIARATHTTSQFGVEYDSLADLNSFGVAPALLMYVWALEPLGRMGWLAGFLYTICGALRLARFNTQAASGKSDTFTGLPIPGAAGMNASLVLFCEKFGIIPSPVLVLLLLYLLSFLMVSTIAYTSFKKPELFRKMNFNMLVMVILALFLIAAQHEIALFLIGVTYTASGPVAMFNEMRHRDLKEEDSMEEDEEEEEEEEEESSPF